MTRVDAEPLGQQIRRARERARMTQRELAEKLGVDPKTIDNWENSRRRPRSSLGAIEDVLGEWGFGRDGLSQAPRTGADGVIGMILEVLDSRFSPAVQVEMIRDVIDREYQPAAGEGDGDGDAGTASAV